MYSRLRRDDGVALIAALMAMMLMLVLGAALTMMTITETRIAENHREGLEVLYAADGGIELAVSDLRSVLDWSDVLSGTTTSTLADGPPDGSRRLADGETITLADERPSDADGQRWRLYAYGLLADMLPGTSVNPRVYVVVWVGEDPSGVEGALILRARAYGSRGARRAVEVTIRKGATIQRLSWRER